MDTSLLDRATSPRTFADVPARAPRFDLYSTIHKGIRAFINSTLEKVGAMDAGDADEVEATLAETRELLMFLRGHLQHENEFVHSAMQARHCDSSLRTAGDHVEHEQAIDDLLHCASEVEHATSATRHRDAQRLYRQLALFAAENFEHMHVEETENNAVLWATYTDPELAAIHGRILASVPPAEMALGLKWMMPALSHVERCELLEGMRKSAPTAVFDHMLGSIRPMLSARNWDKLAQALGL